MKTGIRNGMIMMALYFTMLFAISLIPTGDVNRFIEIHQSYDSLDWQVEITTFLGLFAVGFLHGVRRTPIALLLVGFSLIPLIVWLLILPLIAFSSRHIISLIFAVITPSLAFIPTLVYWITKKYSRPKN
jgi:hypothetical protein